jgi:hypothetical protein
MRIVFLTREGFDSLQTFRYMFAHVAASFPDVHIVAISRSQAENKPFLPWLQDKVRTLLWKAQRFGFVHAFEVLTSYPLWVLISRHQRRKAGEIT